MPSTSASKLGTYKNGATVTITGQYNDGDSYNGTTVSGDWYQISVSGRTGYVSADYITIISDSSSQSTYEVRLSGGTATVAIGDTLVTTTGVNERSSPSTSARKLGSISSGTKVTVVRVVLDGSTYNGSEVDGNWIQIKGGGFVSADYLRTR